MTNKPKNRPEAWQFRKDAKPHDAAPRMHKGVVGTRIPLSAVKAFLALDRYGALAVAGPVVWDLPVCKGCGVHQCGCVQRDALKAAHDRATVSGRPIITAEQACKHAEWEETVDSRPRVCANPRCDAGYTRADYDRWADKHEPDPSDAWATMTLFERRAHVYNWLQEHPVEKEECEHLGWVRGDDLVRCTACPAQFTVADRQRATAAHGVPLASKETYEWVQANPEGKFKQGEQVLIKNPTDNQKGTWIVWKAPPSGMLHLHRVGSDITYAFDPSRVVHVKLLVDEVKKPLPSTNQKFKKGDIVRFGRVKFVLGAHDLDSDRSGVRWDLLDLESREVVGFSFERPMELALDEIPDELRFKFSRGDLVRVPGLDSNFTLGDHCRDQKYPAWRLVGLQSAKDEGWEFEDQMKLMGVNYREE